MNNRYYVPSAQLTNILNNVVNVVPHVQIQQNFQQPHHMSTRQNVPLINTFPLYVNTYNIPTQTNAYGQPQFDEQAAKLNQHEEAKFSEDDIYDLDDDRSVEYDGSSDDLFSEIQLNSEANKELSERKQTFKQKKKKHSAEETEEEKLPIDLIKSSLYFQTFVEKPRSKSEKIDIKTAFPEIGDCKVATAVKPKGNIIQFKALSNTTLSNISTRDTSTFKVIKKHKHKSLKTKSFSLPSKQNLEFDSDLRKNSETVQLRYPKRSSPRRTYVRRSDSDDDDELFQRIYNETVLETGKKRNNSKSHKFRKKRRSKNDSFSKSPSPNRERNNDRKSRHCSRSSERRKSHKKETRRHRSRSFSLSPRRMRKKEKMEHRSLRSISSSSEKRNESLKIYKHEKKSDHSPTKSSVNFKEADIEVGKESPRNRYYERNLPNEHIHSSQTNRRQQSMEMNSRVNDGKEYVYQDSLSGSKFHGYSSPHHVSPYEDHLKNQDRGTPQLVPVDVDTSRYYPYIPGNDQGILHAHDLAVNRFRPGDDAYQPVGFRHRPIIDPRERIFDPNKHDWYDHTGRFFDPMADPPHNENYGARTERRPMFRREGQLIQNERLSWRSSLANPSPFNDHMVYRDRIRSNDSLRPPDDIIRRIPPGQRRLAHERPASSFHSEKQVFDYSHSSMKPYASPTHVSPLKQSLHENDHQLPPTT